MDKPEWRDKQADCERCNCDSDCENCECKNQDEDQCDCNCSNHQDLR